MSTASDQTTENERHADSPNITGELVMGMQSFIDAFMRWSKANAAAAGPSLARLRVLNTLHCEGPMKMADLADALEVTPRNITALVDGLEGEGLVQRSAHPTDRRVTLVELTDKANDAEKLFAAHQDSVAGLCSVMTADEQREYLRLTRLLEDRLREGQVDSQTLAS